MRRLTRRPVDDAVERGKLPMRVTAAAARYHVNDVRIILPDLMLLLLSSRRRCRRCRCCCCTKKLNDPRRSRQYGLDVVSDVVHDQLTAPAADRLRDVIVEPWSSWRRRRS